MRTILISWIAMALGLLGQTSSVPEIEVATIKPAAWPSEDLFERVRIIQNGCVRQAPQVSGNRLTWNLASLCTLIRSAYDIEQLDQLVGGPKKLQAGDAKLYFDTQVLVKIPEGATVNREQSKAVLRALLAERFHLTIHTEERELPVYEMKVSKGGPKVSPRDLAVCERNRPGRFLQSCTATYTMGRFATLLSSYAGRAVVDHTEFTGTFAFLLTWSDLEIVQPQDSAPGLFTALDDQLGLKLESAKAKIPVWVIDSLESPSDN